MTNETEVQNNNIQPTDDSMRGEELTKLKNGAVGKSANSKAPNNNSLSDEALDTAVGKSGEVIEGLLGAASGLLVTGLVDAVKGIYKPFEILSKQKEQKQKNSEHPELLKNNRNKKMLAYYAGRVASYAGASAVLVLTFGKSASVLGGPKTQYGVSVGSVKALATLIYKGYQKAKEFKHSLDKDGYFGQKASDISWQKEGDSIEQKTKADNRLEKITEIVSAYASRDTRQKNRAGELKEMREAGYDSLSERDKAEAKEIYQKLPQQIKDQFQDLKRQRKTSDKDIINYIHKSKLSAEKAIDSKVRGEQGQVTRKSETTNLAKENGQKFNSYLKKQKK